MDKNFDFQYAAFENLASSWSVDGGVNNKYLLWVSDHKDSEEKEFYVLENTRHTDLEENHYAEQYVPEKEYVIKYSYTGPWKNGKTWIHFHNLTKSEMRVDMPGKATVAPIHIPFYLDPSLSGS